MTRPLVCWALVSLELTPNIIPTDNPGISIPASANLQVLRTPLGIVENSSRVILFFFLPSLPVYTYPTPIASAILVFAEKVTILLSGRCLIISCVSRIFSGCS